MRKLCEVNYVLIVERKLISLKVLDCKEYDYKVESGQIRVEKGVVVVMSNTKDI